MITPNGGVFGRNPKFNNVTVTGTLTASGAISAAQSITIGSGANLVMASGSGINFAATADPVIVAAQSARGVIERTATNVSNNDTVTIGTTVYTFKTTLTPANYEVLIGVDAAASLLNLRHAILGTGGTPGTDYQVPGPNAFVTADAISGSRLPLVAITDGTSGNSIALAETSAQLAVSGSTLGGGTNATVVSTELFDDYEEGTWTPSIVFTTGTPITVTYTVRLGSYVKIGRMVFATCQLATSSIDMTGTTGHMRVSGLPYASSSSIIANWPGCFGGDNLLWNSAPTRCNVNGTQLVPFLSTGAVVQTTDVSTTFGANRNRMTMTGIYLV